MADIICIECKSTVSDASGFCPECGYPFDTPLAGQKDVATSIESVAEENIIEGTVTADTVILESAVESTVAEEPNSPEIAANIQIPEVIQQTLTSINSEIANLQIAVTEMKQNFDSTTAASTDNTQKSLSALALKLDEILQYNGRKEAEAQAIAAKETKKGLLASFYKTLNAPNSMFEYMFYITIVQIIFVIVNLFLVAYIVTLVR